MNRIRIHGAFLLALVLWGFFSCHTGKKRSVRPAFYFWKTEYRTDTVCQNYRQALNARILFIKIFDIGRNPQTGRIEPYAGLSLADTTGLRARELVPCVFLTNEVFRNITGPEMDLLADSLAVAINDHELRAFLPSPFEVQFDCDWTPSTRDAFFAFLKKIRLRLPENTRTSATIRLHQYKYRRQTGVPPVDRGMLMFYNTGDIERPETENSIFRYPDAEAYLQGAPARYPLPLDVALPVFSWSLAYRNDRLWKIIPGLRPAELADTAFFQPIDLARGPIDFEVRKATLREGSYLRPGDVVRWESVGPRLIQDAAGLAARFDLAADTRVAFFHLDSLELQRYRPQTLANVCRIVQNSPRY